MNEEQRYLHARERVREIKWVYVHVFVYLLVNAGLGIVNLIQNPSHLWFYWILLGWGLGLAAHAFSVFVIGGLFGHDWEERKIQKILRKIEMKEDKAESNQKPTQE